MTKGDAAADSVDEIFASVLCFNMGETSPDGNDSIFSYSILGAQKKSTAELLQPGGNSTSLWHLKNNYKSQAKYGSTLVFIG